MTINNNTYFQDEDYNLNIDDIDLHVKAWSLAVSSSLEFMKSLLMFPIFYEVSLKIFEFFILFKNFSLVCEKKIK
jgi:hypothetical protein